MVASGGNRSPRRSGTMKGDYHKTYRRLDFPRSCVSTVDILQSKFLVVSCFKYNLLLNMLIYIVGSGKSMLAYSELVYIANFRSSVIYKLTKANWKCSNTAPAYFYCDGSNEAKQDPRRIFGSLFRQLLMQTSSCTKSTKAFMASVTDFYKRNKYRDFRIRTRLESLVNYLISTSSFFNDVTIVIDGLDECLP